MVPYELHGIRPARARSGLSSILLMVSVLLLIHAGCGGGQPDNPVPAQEPERQGAPTGSAQTTSSPSMAKQWATKVKATLDQTSLEELMVQMPDDIAPVPARNGESRSFTWTFGDGSQLVTTFRPRGGEGSGAGLVLYMVDIKEGARP